MDACNPGANCNHPLGCMCGGVLTIDDRGKATASVYNGDELMISSKIVSRSPLLARILQASDLVVEIRAICDISQDELFALYDRYGQGIFLVDWLDDVKRALLAGSTDANELRQLLRVKA